MKKVLSIVFALVMVISVFSSCGDTSNGNIGEPKSSKLKQELTDQSLTYSKSELEALKASEHYLYDKDVPALYKYFEGKCQIGCIVNSWQIANYDDLMAKGLLKHYNIYTMENECKPSSVNPSEGVYNFDPIDAFVKFGEDAGAELRGHTLVWHAQVPDWWFKADPKDTRSLKECNDAGALATSEQLTERIETYIDKVVTRYKGKIKYWDVCNEVLNADSIRKKYDDSFWADIIGDVDKNGYKDDYVEIAFNAARKADPDAVLMINDFNMEWQDSKTQAMYDMVERMLRKGVRIDGVGFQSHIGLDTNIDGYRRNLEKIAGLAAVYDECFPEYKGNFRIQITELDMNVFVGENRDKNFVRWTDEDYKQHADKYAELMDLFLDYADKGILDAVVFWTPDDDHSWINSNKNGQPSLFDKEMKLKQSFYAFAATSFKH